METLETKLPNENQTIKKTMKAAVVEGYGSPDVIKIKNI